MAEGRLQAPEHDEDLKQLVNVEVKDDDVKIDERRNKCIGEKLHLAISVLVILCVISLIVNFTFKKQTPFVDSLMAFEASLTGQNTNAEDDGKSKYLEISAPGVQKKRLSQDKRDGRARKETGQISSNTVSLRSQIQEAKLLLNEIKSQSLQNQQRSEDLQQKEANMRKLSQALIYSSDDPITESPQKGTIPPENSKTQLIFNTISQNPHHSVRSTTIQKREGIISHFFSNKRPQERLLTQILKQNYLLQPQRTANDDLYMAQLNLHVSTEEDPKFICTVVSTHNNAFNGQILRTLNSIFNQQYHHYQVIIADSFSNDQTRQLVKQYIANPQVADRARLAEYNSESLVFSAYSASKLCKEGSLIVYLDGNSELIGKEVFHTINSHFFDQRPNILYADQFSLYADKGKLQRVRAADYDESQKFMPLYRSMPKKYGSMFIARSGLLTYLPQSYVNYNGKSFEYSRIDSLALSLLELSCGKIKTISVPLVLSIRDSSIEQRERAQRLHELKQIQMKSKLNYC